MTCATRARLLTARTIDGRDEELSRYLGQVALVVNVASHCGFTPQCAQLQSLHEGLESRGFTVLGAVATVTLWPRNDNEC